MSEQVYRDDRGKDTETFYTLWKDGVWTRRSQHIASGHIYDEVEIPEAAVPADILDDVNRSK